MLVVLIVRTRCAHGAPFRTLHLAVRYLTAIAREKAAFKKLIENKATMLVPLPSLHMPASQHAAASSSSSSSASFSMDTRTVLRGPDGKQAVPAPTRDAAAAQDGVRRLVVDVREFRSSLPSMLHQRGLKLDAVTLTVRWLRPLCARRNAHRYMRITGRWATSF